MMSVSEDVADMYRQRNARGENIINPIGRIAHKSRTKKDQQHKWRINDTIM